MLHFSWERIWKNPLKNVVICFLLLFPSLEIVLYLRNSGLGIGGKVYNPDFAFFLGGNIAQYEHFFQAIYLWLMPIYCLVVVAEDCIEDFTTGYSNILITKFGKKSYIRGNLTKGFLISFLTILCAMVINLVLVHLLFQDGHFSPYGDICYAEGVERWGIEHPLLANLAFSIVTSFFCGMISMVGVISVLIFHSRKVAYGITILAWLAPVICKNSLMLVFQPRSEYSLETLAMIAVTVLIPYGLYIVIGYYKEVRFE